ncbi:MAG: carbohydrate ABC transporter substrate-binding protein [Acidimicrobiales bacterium]|nr:carbohydrate ABC transporter substrate-binding protein [Acidimicrobiales bacterium]
MSKWMKLLAALFAVSLIAAACGSDAADTVSDVASDDLDAAQSARDDALAAAEAAQAEAEAAKAEADEAKAALDAAGSDDGGPAPREFEGEVVRISGPERSAEEWNALEAGMVPFEEATGAEVIYTGSADWEAEINVQLAAGNPPDISSFPQPGKLADFARQGFLEPLRPEVLEATQAEWAQSHIDFALVDGEFYGVPVKTDLKSIVWHKPAVFDANGYEHPGTWDELKELTNTMIADGITPWCVGIESGQATGWTFTDWTEDLMLRFHGGEAYDQWVSNDLKFASDEVNQVMQEIIDLWSIDGAVFGGIESISSSHFASKPAEDLIADNCAMVRQASFFSGFLPEGTSDQISTFYFPAVDPATAPVLVAGQHAAAFNDRDVVSAVLEHMGSSSYVNARQTFQREAKGGGLSGFNTANTAADRSLWADLEGQFIEVMQNAEVARFDGSDLMPADVGAGEFWTQATAIVNGEIDVAGGTAKIDEAWPSE